MTWEQLVAKARTLGLSLTRKQTGGVLGLGGTTEYTLTSLKDPSIVRTVNNLAEIETILQAVAQPTPAPAEPAPSPAWFKEYGQLKGWTPAQTEQIWQHTYEMDTDPALPDGTRNPNYGKRVANEAKQNVYYTDWANLTGKAAKAVIEPLAPNDIPPEPSDWKTIVPGIPWANIWMRDPKTGQPVISTAFDQVYQSYLAQRERVATAAAKPPAKRPPYAGGPEYRGPDAQGNTWYRSGPDDDWDLVSPKKARTLTEALTAAILADKPDQAEIDRLMGIINKIEASSPGFIAQEKQRALQEAQWQAQFGATQEQREWERQRQLRQEAVEAEQLALQRARSPGDWLTWWSMMNRANQPTAEQFQRFGAERFAPGMAGVFQPQVAQAGAVPAPQQQMMFAPAQNVGYGQPQFQAAQKAVQDEIEKRYNQWLNSLDARMYEDLDEPTKARVRAEIEAQVKKEFPLPETFTGFGATGGGYGTTNRAIYEEYQRRMAAGEPLNQEMIFRGQAPAPEKMPYTGQAPSVETMPYLTPEQRAILDAIPLAGTPETLARAASDREAYMEAFRRQPATRAGTTPAARGGLDWLSVARSGQPIPEPRLAANIPGVPAYPNPQTWANLLPSQKEAYKASVEMQGIPFADYWKQYQEQIPKGYVPPGYMFRRQPSYVRQ